MRTLKSFSAYLWITLLPAFLCSLAYPAHAEIRLPKVFNNHMVMQQEKPLVVWGWIVPLMRDGRMRERETQKIFVAEAIIETVLKCGEIGHGENYFKSPVCESSLEVLRAFFKSSQWPKIHMTE